MARVGPIREAADRGQLLLVAGFGLAVMLVALALVLNGAIYSEAQASRGVAVADRDVARYQDDVHRSVSELVVATNRPGNASEAELQATFEAGVANWSRLSARHSATAHATTNVSLASAVYGSQVVQSDQRNFTNASGAGNWTVAESVSGVRGFRMNVSRTALANGSCGPTTCFQVVVDNGSATWRVTVTATEQTVNLSVSGPTGPGSCGVTGEWAHVDLTAGTLAGEPCPALAFAEGVSAPYDVAYLNGDDVAGTYRLVVDEPIAEDGDFATDGAPSTSAAVYSANVTLAYQTSTLAYTTELRVAPGEPDG